MLYAGSSTGRGLNPLSPTRRISIKHCAIYGHRKGSVSLTTQCQPAFTTDPRHVSPFCSGGHSSCSDTLR